MYLTYKKNTNTRIYVITELYYLRMFIKRIQTYIPKQNINASITSIILLRLKLLLLLS